MNAFNYRFCLSGNAINSGVLNALYDFTGGSGNFIYNSLHSVPAHFYQGRMLGSKNPGVFIRSGSSLPNAVTGQFGGQDVFVMGDINDKEPFTFVLDYDLNFCAVTGNKSSVLLSTLINATDTSGFAFGFNQSNRLFFEYYNSGAAVTGIHTLNVELGNKNTVILSYPGNRTIDFGFYDYEVDAYRGQRFSIPGYNHSDKIFVGGMNRYSGVEHSGFSGNFNSLLYFTGYFPDSLKGACVDCLFSNGVTFNNTTGSYNIYSVTGFAFSLSGQTGVTGYAYNLINIPHPTGGVSQVWRESGLSGVLRQAQAILPLTGLRGTGTTILGALAFNLDYASKQEYGIKDIKFTYPLASGDLLEVYSYQKPQLNLNIPSNNFYLNKSGYRNAQLFQNGLLNIQDIDYRLTSNTIVGEAIQGYDPTDVLNYNLINESVIVTDFSGLWSGGRIVLNQGSSGTGIDYYPRTSQYLESGTDIIITGVSGAVVTGYDLFLNGQKLAQDFNYEITTSGAIPVVKLYGTFLPYFSASVVYTGSFVSGYPSYPPLGISNVEPDVLVFAQKTTGTVRNRLVQYITGNVSSVTITGYSEQVWINGVKQVGKMYDKVYACSPSSGEFDYSQSTYTFYDAGGYLNIE